MFDISAAEEMTTDSVFKDEQSRDNIDRACKVHMMTTYLMKGARHIAIVILVRGIRDGGGHGILSRWRSGAM